MTTETGMFPFYLGTAELIAFLTPSSTMLVRSFRLEMSEETRESLVCSVLRLICKLVASEVRRPKLKSRMEPPFPMEDATYELPLLSSMLSATVLSVICDWQPNRLLLLPLSLLNSELC